MDIHSPVNAVDDDTISKLESTFGGSLHIQDDQKLEHVSDADDIGNCHVGEGRLYRDFEWQQTTLKMKSSKKCSTFPYPDMVLPSSSSDEEADTSSTESLSEQSPHQSYSCSASQKAPQKLVSAMKGSREKLGGPLMKLSVKWAPDVYDPVPTLSSHTVKIRKQPKSRMKKSEKKYGKKVQKEKYSKGGSSKDKKQYRNSWPEACSRRFDASMELNNLNAVSHDSYHGISNSKIPATENPCHVGETMNNILDFISYIKTA
ncbi:uncharacterized protein [Cicer arietinum]|uniref:Uncharacterized protein LOC101502221 n=1 Tax=Cicer arietinum TaxID=3827 RepID=A0A1S2XV38_CICAR|nr:uncharacterized protein LOC101502221 [Cicer arietinum]